MKHTGLIKIDPYNKNVYELLLNERELHVINDSCSLRVDIHYGIDKTYLRNLSCDVGADVGASFEFLEKIGVAILELESLMSSDMTIVTKVNVTRDELLIIREIAVHGDPHNRHNPKNTLKIKVLKLLFEETLKNKIMTSEMVDVLNSKEDGNE